MAKKQLTISTNAFASLWGAIRSVLRSSDPQQHLDLQADITNSCRTLAQYLKEHPDTSYDRGDSTIYKNLLGFVQAQKGQREHFSINGPLLHALTAVVHGAGARFEEYYPYELVSEDSPEGLQDQFLETMGEGFDSDEAVLSPQSLGDWLRARPQKNLKLWIFAGLLLLVVGLILELTYGSLVSPLWVLGIEWGWLLGISLLIFGQPSVNDNSSVQQLRASQAVRRFWNYWLLLWLAWFVFYIFLFSAAWFWPDSPHPLWMEGLLHFLNNGSALCLGLMYLELSERTDDSNRQHQQWYPFLLCWVLLGGLEAMLLSLDPQWVLPLSIFSGILGGGAMALFVSRFSSKIWDVPQSVIFCLVGYAIIQPSLPFITQTVETAGGMGFMRFLAVFLLIYAFVGKMLLLLVVHWLRNTERLRYYMLRIPLLQAQEHQLMHWGVSKLKVISEKGEKA
ncbi:MAG: hypothetical protein AAFQ68_01290 [Bacteroidota bacterium]